MALKDRAAESIGGPDGQSTWWDNGFAFTLQNHAGIVAPAPPGSNLPAGIVPIPSKVLPGGLTNPDSVPSGSAIQSISGAQICALTTLAASAITGITLSVFRAGAQIGGGPAFGWTIAGGGTPALTALTAINMPVIAANTAFVVTPAGSYIPLQPLDVLVVNIQSTGGAVTIPVSMITGTMI